MFHTRTYIHIHLHTYTHRDCFGCVVMVEAFRKFGDLVESRSRFLNPRVWRVRPRNAVFEALGSRAEGSGTCCLSLAKPQTLGLKF